MGGSKNSGTPKSSILIGFPIINHPFWGTPIFGNTHVSKLIHLFVGHCWATFERFQPIRQFLNRSSSNLIEMILCQKGKGLTDRNEMME